MARYDALYLTGTFPLGPIRSLPYITLLLDCCLIAKLGSKTAPNSESLARYPGPTPGLQRYEIPTYFFAIFMCIPQIKIFQKNGKRSTQEEADEVSQVRQEDDEENHQEYSGP